MPKVDVHAITTLGTLATAEARVKVLEGALSDLVDACSVPIGNRVVTRRPDGVAIDMALRALLSIPSDGSEDDTCVPM
jgi:hypothetical protein